MVLGLAFNFFRITSLFIGNEIIVKTTLTYSPKMTYPAVTICNMNPIKQSLIGTNPRLQALVDSWTATTNNRRRRDVSLARYRRQIAEPGIVDCPADSIYYGEYCYTISTYITDFESARNACEVLDGNLVWFENAEEFDMVNFMFYDLYTVIRYWTGLYDPVGNNDASEYIFTWGGSPSYTAWGNNQPNEIDARCVENRRINEIWTWNDYDCSGPRRFICKFKHNERVDSNNVTFEETACENQATQIACPGSSLVHITSVFYGREDNDTCTDENANHTYCECLAREGCTIRVLEQCENQASCYANATSDFMQGGICDASSAYLRVLYQCDTYEDQLTTIAPEETTEEPTTTDEASFETTTNTTNNQTQTREPRHSTQRADTTHVTSTSSSTLRIATQTTELLDLVTYENYSSTDTTTVAAYTTNYVHSGENMTFNYSTGATETQAYTSTPTTTTAIESSDTQSSITTVQAHTNEESTYNLDVTTEGLGVNTGETSVGTTATATVFNLVNNDNPTTVDHSNSVNLRDISILFSHSVPTEERSIDTTATTDPDNQNTRDHTNSVSVRDILSPTVRSATIEDISIDTTATTSIFYPTDPENQNTLDHTNSVSVRDILTSSARSAPTEETALHTDTSTTLSSTAIENTNSIYHSNSVTIRDTSTSHSSDTETHSIQASTHPSNETLSLYHSTGYRTQTQTTETASMTQMTYTNVSDDLSITTEPDIQETSNPLPSVDHYTINTWIQTQGEEYTEEFLQENDLLVFLAETPVDIKRELGFNFSEIVSECSFLGQDCDERNFTSFFDATHGNCYVFNSGWNSTKVNSISQTGGQQALKLTVKLNQHEYIEEVGEAAGAVVVVHEQDRFPFPEDEGILALPGHINSIGVRKVSIQRLGGVYGDCTDADLNHEELNVFEEHYTDTKYSRTACFKTCYQRNVLKRCHCGDPVYPMTGSAFSAYNAGLACDSRNATQNLCVNDVTDDFINNRLDCDCHNPCFEQYYKYYLSKTTWPSQVHLAGLLDQYNSYISRYSNISSEAEFFGKNFLTVEVYFESLVHRNLVEFPKYPSVVFRSDVGSIVGLWLGLSVFSVIELLELFCDFIVLLCSKVIRKVRSKHFTHVREVHVASTTSLTSLKMSSATSLQSNVSNENTEVRLKEEEIKQAKKAALHRATRLAKIFDSVESVTQVGRPNVFHSKTEDFEQAVKITDDGSKKNHKAFTAIKVPHTRSPRISP